MLRSAMTGAAAFALLLAVLAGCGEDTSEKFIPFEPDPGGGTDSTLFVGFLADDGSSGELEIVIDTQSLAPGHRSRTPQVPGPTVAAFAVLHWPGGDVVLAGVYDFTADTLYLTGAGRELRGSFAGSGNTGIIRGGATTPSGPAGFVAAHDPGAPFRPWLGAFHSADLADSGTLCFVRAETVLAGQAFHAGATAAMRFDGEVSSTGSPRALTFDFTLPTMYGVTGSGSLNDATAAATGTYAFTITNAAYGSSSAGTWAATRH